MRNIILFILILTPLFNFSQKKAINSFTINGKIVDSETKKPIEDAAIVFKHIDSSTITYGGITNSRGYFSVDITEGKYIATVNYICYKPKEINISEINRDLNIGTVELDIDTNYLNEIEIVGSKKTVQIKPNKIVFNVKNDIASSGGVATDILNNIPSVSVDPSGNITVQGQGHVQVMINGKTSSLSKTNALKSLPAGSIENIEVITNPGARYKADALSIINIILKKGKDIGLNASITSTAGYKDYYGGLVSLNNKTKNINFFTNLSYNHSNPITISNSQTEYFSNGATTSFLNEETDFDSKNDAFYGSIGSDFYISKKTSLTASINFQNLHNNRDSYTFTEIFDENKNLNSSNQRNLDSEFNNELIEFSFDLEHNFNDSGKQLTSSFVFTNDLDDFDNSFNNSNSNFNFDNFIEKNKLTNRIIDVKFLNSIGNKSNYVVGYYGEFGEIDYKRDNLTSENNIEYSEKINAAFAEYEYENDKFYLGLSMRGEFSKINVNYKSLNSFQKNTFNNLVPSTYLQYSLSDVKSLSLSYNSAILRPGANDLQPFEEKYSETSSYQGNPNLTPINVDNFNFNYTYYGNKITFSPSIRYQIFDNYMQNITYETGEQVNGVNKILTTPINLGNVKIYGINISTIYKVNNQLSFTSNIDVYNFDQVGNFEILNKANNRIEFDYNQANINGSFSLLTQLNLPKLFDFQINAKHFLDSEGPYSIRKNYTYASAAINKELFNNNASISLTLNDIFNSNQTNRNRFYDQYTSKSLIKNKYRNILLSFTYRFNQSKKSRLIDFERKQNKPNY